MLGIDDLYIKFCIDETANYIYQKLLDEANLKNQGKDLKTLMKRHAVKKRK
jgi:tRNA threonylcarbamoyladenosine modification (KEOPS) complex  Pcc1 subunit